MGPRCKSFSATGLWLLLSIGALNASGAEDSGAEQADSMPVTQDRARVEPSGDAESLDQEMLEDLQTDVLRYRREIQHLEASHGAFDASLAEKLTGLGLLYQRAGMHAEALASFRRALHVSRISDGLYSFSGVPIIENMIESHVALGQWDEVNNRYHFLFQLADHNYGKSDPRMLPALEKLSKWHLKAYSENYSDNPLNHLIAARNLFDSAVQIIAVNFGDHDLRLAEPLRKRTLVDYYLAVEMPQSGNRNSLHDSSGASFSFGNSSSGVEADQIVINSFSAGRRALDSIRGLYEANEDSSLEERVGAIVDLGDWNMLFDRRQSAMEAYDEALALIGDGPGNVAVHQRFFGKPRALPAARFFDDSEQPPVAESSTGNKGYVLMKFTVDPSGHARKFEVVDADPADDKSIQTKLRRRIRATRFRPRFEGRQPILTEDVYYRYRFTY